MQLTVLMHMPLEQPNAHDDVCAQAPLTHCSMSPMALQRTAPLLHVMHMFEVQVPPPGQSCASDQSRQPEACLSHVCSESEATQRSSPMAHRLVHELTQLPPEQTSPPLHGIGSDQSRQPVALSSHDCTPVPEHCVAPGAQRSLQAATQAPPEQTWPLGHAVTVGDQSLQPPAPPMQVR